MGKKGWFIVIVTVLIAIVVFSLPRLAQNPAYNNFADQRTFFGIPHFNDVVSNIFFLILGVMGLRRSRGLYRFFFCMIIFVGFGSGFYHIAPDNLRLFWDRMPISLAFMTLLSIVLAERVSPALIRWLAPALILAGMAATFYWLFTEMRGVGSLRPYLLVEYYPVAAIPLLCIFYPREGDRYLYMAIIVYVFATIFEDADQKIFTLTHEIISGHTLKHLMAALGVYFIYRKSVMAYNKL